MMGGGGDTSGSLNQQEGTKNLLGQILFEQFLCLQFFFKIVVLFFKKLNWILCMN